MAFLDQGQGTSYILVLSVFAVSIAALVWVVLVDDGSLFSVIQAQIVIPAHVFRIINDTSVNDGTDADNVTANSVTDTVHFIEGPGIDLIFNFTDQTINFTSTAAGGGEANTASNIGGGVGVFESKAAADLQFKSLNGTGGITVQSNGTDILINGTAIDGSGIGAGDWNATVSVYFHQIGFADSWQAVNTTDGSIISGPSGNERNVLQAALDAASTGEAVFIKTPFRAINIASGLTMATSGVSLIGEGFSNYGGGNPQEGVLLSAVANDVTILTVNDADFTQLKNITFKIGGTTGSTALNVNCGANGIYQDLYFIGNTNGKVAINVTSDGGCTVQPVANFFRNIQMTNFERGIEINSPALCASGNYYDSIAMFGISQIGVYLVDCLDDSYFNNVGVGAPPEPGAFIAVQIGKSDNTSNFVYDTHWTDFACTGFENGDDTCIKIDDDNAKGQQATTRGFYSATFDNVKAGGETITVVDLAGPNASRPDIKLISNSQDLRGSHLERLDIGGYFEDLTTITTNATSGSIKIPLATDCTDLLFGDTDGVIGIDNSTDNFCFRSGDSWQQLNTTMGDNLGDHTATQTLDMATHEIQDIGIFNLNAPTTLTLSAQAITLTQSFHSVESEGATSCSGAAPPASQNCVLDTISGGTVGDIIIIKSISNGRDITISDSTGNILLDASANFTLTHIHDTITLLYNGAFWVEISRSDT